MYWKFALQRSNVEGGRDSWRWLNFETSGLIKGWRHFRIIPSWISWERPLNKNQPLPSLLPRHHQVSSFDLPCALYQDSCTLVQVQNWQSQVNMGWDLWNCELKWIISPFSWLSQILCHKNTKLTHQLNVDLIPMKSQQTNQRESHPRKKMQNVLWQPQILFLLNYCNSSDLGLRDSDDFLYNFFSGWWHLAIAVY